MATPIVISVALTPLTIKLARKVNKFMIKKLYGGLETGEIEVQNKYLRDFEPEIKKELEEKLEGTLQKLEDNLEKPPRYLMNTLAGVSASSCSVLSGYFTGQLLRTIF